MGIETGIFKLFGLQRPLGPVVALPFLVQDNPVMLFKNPRQPQLLIPKQLTGNSRIEQVVDLKLIVALQAKHIIGGGMKDFFDLRICKNASESPQVRQCQWIENVVAVTGRHLE